MGELISFEHVLDYVGSSGRWQVFIYVLTSISGFFNAFHSLGSIFLAATPDHWCDFSTGLNKSLWDESWTQERVKDYAIPIESDGKYSHCLVYQRNFSDTFSRPWNESLISNSSSEDLEIVSCSSWIYDGSVFESTVVTEWNLVCSNAPLAATVQATYMMGIFFGTLMFGFVSDRFGRCFAILIAQVELSIGAILAMVPISYTWFILFRFLTGMGTGGVFSCAFVLMAESISPRLRDVAGIAFQLPFGLGYMVLPLIGYYIRSWTTLQLTMGLMTLLLVIYFWLLPESPRWLILHDRLDEAYVILRTVAKLNKRDIVTSHELQAKLKSVCNNEGASLTNGVVEKPTTCSIYFDLFKTPQMRKRILVSYFAWFSVSLCYYGLSFLSPTMGSDIYMIGFLTAATEIPSYLLGCVTIRYFSRRLNVIGTFLISGICCLLILAVPKDETAIITGFAITGKFFINITYAIVYLYATEIFPTKNRNIALGTSSMCARVGAAIAPYIVDLLKGNLPLLIFGTLAIVAGLLCILLPETKDRFLPQTINDVENCED